MQVRFGRAIDFVSEYAENLSAGGLFIAGRGEGLDPLMEIEVEVQLPGFGSFTVGAKVAHIISPASAAKRGGRAGAGLEIIRRPANFDASLAEYLRLLGRRRDVAVMIEPGVRADLLTAAGYNLVALPTPEQLSVQLSRSTQPVVAVLVTASDEPTYRMAARDVGLDDLITVFDDLAELETVIATIDRVL